ncbi:MAG: class I SAM-dependent methyltransferase [Candidatus Nealsonbacteria bacterium]|nr:class I SAM-dependent methyltransferase [Candidatus Nealsonbacteria bacterium]
MPFGYIPDYQEKSFLKDFYFKIFGYPYPPRKNEAILVFKFLDPQKHEKILDIGCGDGAWYNELRKNGIKVTGLDISSYDLNKLKERAKALNLKPDVVKADAQKIPFKQNTFDKVYSICTFEHIKDDKKVFEEVARVLKPKGLLVISLPMKEVPLLTKMAIKLPEPIKKLFYNRLVVNAKNKEDYLNNFNKHYFHYRNYTIEDIKERLKKYNFEIEKKSYNCRFFGSAIWSAYHTLKIFERNKSSETNYKFRNETAFALVAPFFYLLFLIDRWLFWTKGKIIILKLRKK